MGWILVELKNGILVWSSGMDFGDFGVELRNGILVELSLKLRSNPVGGGGGGGGDSSAMVYNSTNGIQCRVKILASMASNAEQNNGVNGLNSLTLSHCCQNPQYFNFSQISNCFFTPYLA
jgi:hypothetical protein